MNSVRRLTTSLYAKFEDLLGQVESHETLTTAALAAMNTSLIRAHDELERIDRECRSLKRELHTAREAARNWKNRAILERDDKRALECLRRNRTAQVCELDMRDRLEQRERDRDHVQTALNVLEEKFQELRSRRLRNQRETSSTGRREDPRPIKDISGLVHDDFTRWDLTSGDSDCPPSTTRNSADSFAESYFQKEEEEALLQELEVLRSSPGGCCH
jgi:chromosome segregation ATPase